MAPTPVHKPVKPVHAVKHEKPEPVKKERYTEAIGRRKTAIARVRLYPAGNENSIVVNDRPLGVYFPLKKHQDVVRAPFHALSVEHYKVTVLATGGGTSAQAEAVRLGIARVLVAGTPAVRPQLKALGYMKRDPRMVERKKPGLRKARRPQQWRKR